MPYVNALGDFAYEFMDWYYFPKISIVGIQNVISNVYWSSFKVFVDWKWFDFYLTLIILRQKIYLTDPLYKKMALKV